MSNTIGYSKDGTVFMSIESEFVCEKCQEKAKIRTLIEWEPESAVITANQIKAASVNAHDIKKENMQ